jgi:prepilin-type N-terminal cleavage/methylation domain-containing protein
VKSAQRGFTLLETLLALGVMSAIALFLLSAITNVLRWNAALAEREGSEASLSALTDRMQAEEDSAWAIFTPPRDVYGKSNSDGHELDFFMRDAQNRAHFWAYCYDQNGRSLQRLVYSAPGASAISDGAPARGISAFFARTYPVTALADSSSPVYSSLYQNATLHAAAVRFGFADQPWIAGGNQITYVRFETHQSARALQLSTQTAPSGFTIALRYTPSPGPTALARLTALVATAQLSGHWQDCPDRTKDCSNAEWPQYHWSQTTTSRYYESFDGGYDWTLFDSTKTVDTGISGPIGGDVPSVPCGVDSTADYVRACSADWSPAAPPGTAGMLLTL